MNKHLLIATITLLAIASCKKNDPTTLKSVIHDNTECTWFPLSEQSYFLYTEGNGASGTNPKYANVVHIDNNKLRIGDIVFSHDNCSMLTISYKDLKNAPLLSRTNMEETIWYGGTINGITYTTFQASLNREFVKDNKTYTERFARLDVKQKNGAKQIIGVYFLENTGISSVIIEDIGSMERVVYNLSF